MKQVVFVATLFASVGFGGTIFDVPALSTNGATPALAAEGWSETSTYTNVAISADLLAGPGYTAWLMNQIGPGTTAANQVAVNNNFTANGSPVFSGLTLGPGNYYLVIQSPVTGSSGWTVVCAFSATCTHSLAPDATFLGVANATSPAAYIPASSFTFRGDAQEFVMTVTGTAGVPTPEPSTVYLFSAGFGFLAWTRARSRRGQPRRYCAPRDGRCWSQA